MNGSHTVSNSRSTNRRGVLRVLGVVAALALGTATATAAPTAVAGPDDASVELTLLHGTKASADAVPPGWPELGNPPFNAYNHYAILSTKTLALKKGTATRESLPDGSALEATLIDVAPKVKVELVLKDSKGAQVSKGTYSSPKGKRFLPVSTPYKGGSLVIGLKVL